MRIRTKLIGGFCVVILLSVMTAATALIYLRDLDGYVNKIGGVFLPSIIGLSDIEAGQIDVRSNNAVLFKAELSNDQRLKCYNNIAQAWGRIDQGWKTYEPLPQTPEETVAWKAFVSSFGQWKTQAQLITSSLKAWQEALGQKQEEQAQTAFAQAQQAFASAAPPLAQSRQQLSQIIKINHDASHKTIVESENNARQAQTIMLCLTIVSSLIAMVLAWSVSRYITRSLATVTNRIRDIAQGEGDLTKRITVTKQDEVGELSTWFNTFIEKIHNIIFDVSQASREVSSAATQIAASSEEMASGMKEQSSQVTQVSAAIEELSQSVVEVAQKSANAADHATQAGSTAKEGNQVISQTIQGMQNITQAVNAGTESVKELGKRGEQIGQIIQVINDIADQTNLLALNAAIEAARAGEHGRGFAVVADEVRKLADRTTKATEEIANSIKAIQAETAQAVSRMDVGSQQVTQGVEFATQAGTSLQKIVSASTEVIDMIRSIAAAAEQQSAASEEISRTIQSISSVTQQTTEGSNQAASAASQLSTQAEHLQTLVNQFKLASQRQQNEQQSAPAINSKAA